MIFWSFDLHHLFSIFFSFLLQSDSRANMDGLQYLLAANVPNSKIIYRDSEPMYSFCLNGVWHSSLPLDFSQDCFFSIDESDIASCWFISWNHRNRYFEYYFDQRSTGIVRWRSGNITSDAATNDNGQSRVHGQSASIASNADDGCVRAKYVFSIHEYQWQRVDKWKSTCTCM